MAISIRTRKGLTEQHDWMLRRFLHRLDKGKVDTSEVIAVLIILRAQQVSPALLDWCDTIAHPTRTKASAGDMGGLYKTGIALIHEAQFVDTFFRLRKLTVRRLPCAVFDALLEIISDLKLSLQGLGLRALQRRDDFDQYLSDLKKRYMRNGDYYQLQSTARETDLDAPFLLDMLHQLR